MKYGNHVDLRIPRGFLILINGNLSHSGSDYATKDNKWLSFKVMPKGYELKNKEQLDVAPNVLECKSENFEVTFDKMYLHYIKKCKFAPEDVKQNRPNKKSKKSEDNTKHQDYLKAKKNINK
jgi:hypothetical protein